MAGLNKPVVLITGGGGNIGRSLGAALSDAYTIVGLDRPGVTADFPILEADLTDLASEGEMDIVYLEDVRGSIGTKDKLNGLWARVRAPGRPTPATGRIQRHRP